MTIKFTLPTFPRSGPWWVSHYSETCSILDFKTCPSAILTWTNALKTPIYGWHSTLRRFIYATHSSWVYQDSYRDQVARTRFQGLRRKEVKTNQTKQIGLSHRFLGLIHYSEHDDGVRRYSRGDPWRIRKIDEKGCWQLRRVKEHSRLANSKGWENINNVFAVHNKGPGQRWSPENKILWKDFVPRSLRMAVLCQQKYFKDFGLIIYVTQFEKRLFKAQHTGPTRCEISIMDAALSKFKKFATSRKANLHKRAQGRTALLQPYR